VGAKGKKLEAFITSSELGKLVPMCVAASASGNFIPPTSVYPTNYFYQHFLLGDPAGSMGQGMILVRLKEKNF
jgi:hypothetical protein